MGLLVSEDKLLPTYLVEMIISQRKRRKKYGNIYSTVKTTRDEGKLFKEQHTREEEPVSINLFSVIKKFINKERRKQRKKETNRAENNKQETTNREHKQRRKQQRRKQR